MEKHVESCGSAFLAFDIPHGVKRTDASVVRRIMLILLLLYCSKECWPNEPDAFSLKCATGILHRFAAGVLRKSILSPGEAEQGGVTPEYSPG